MSDASKLSRHSDDCAKRRPSQLAGESPPCTCGSDERLVEREAAGIPRDAEVRPGLYVDPAHPVDEDATARVAESMRRHPSSEVLAFERVAPTSLWCSVQVATPGERGHTSVEGSLPPAALGELLREVAGEVDPYPLTELATGPSLHQAALEAVAAWRACQRVTDQASLHAALQRLSDVLDA